MVLRDSFNKKNCYLNQIYKSKFSELYQLQNKNNEIQRRSKLIAQSIKELAKFQDKKKSELSKNEKKMQVKANQVIDPFK